MRFCDLIVKILCEKKIVLNLIILASMIIVVEKKWLNANKVHKIVSLYVIIFWNEKKLGMILTILSVLNYYEYQITDITIFLQPKSISLKHKHYHYSKKKHSTNNLQQHIKLFIR